MNLGLVEQRDFGDPRVGAAVFALPQPGLTEPVHTAFGAVVSQIKSVTPAVYGKTFEQAEPELRAEIAAQRATPEVRKLHEAIEDQRASGKTLAEAANGVGLETKVYDAVDDAGNDRSGKPIASLPAGPDLVKAAFASDIGVDNDTVATRDGGYVWYEVNGIEPARQKTFDEVKEAVAEAMRSEAAQKALAAKAEDIVAKLAAGQPIEDLAKQLGVQAQRANDVKREARPDFTSNVIVQFFDVAPRNAGSVVVDNGRLVFFVRDATTPVFDPNSIESKTIAQQLKPALNNDLLEQYVGGLEKALGVDINQRALEAATGAERDR